MFISSLGKLWSLVFLSGGTTLVSCKLCDKHCPVTSNAGDTDFVYRGKTNSGAEIIFGYSFTRAERTNQPPCPFAQKR